MEKTTIVTPGTLGAIGGGFKKAVGRLIGNEELEAKGRAEELEGQARIRASDRKDMLADKVTEVVQGADTVLQKVEGTVEQVVGAAAGTVGDILQNPKMKADGKAKEKSGQLRRKDAERATPAKTQKPV